MTMHFISGLPRSGSTLLSAVLRQNPRFKADISSGLHGVVNAALPLLSLEELASTTDNALRRRVLLGLFDSFYPERHDQVVLDTQRMWTSHLPLLDELFPDARVVCCVRDLGWVLDSVEQMLAKNPMQMSAIFAHQRLESVYQRVEHMMNLATGLVGKPLTSLREGWFSNFAHKLVVVPYDHLTLHPLRTLKALYEVLGEPWYEHDFNALEFDAPERDAALNMPGLHTVGKQLRAPRDVPGIPPDLFNKYAGSQFWKTENQNPQGVLVL